MQIHISQAVEPFPVGPYDQWEWTPLANMTCMDGKSSGVYLKKGNSSNLGIYLNGGGACFNIATCETAAKNPQPGAPGNGGIFSNSDARNPFADFNWIAVPYCSGDVHIGDAIEKVAYKTRTFAGANNLRLIAEKAKATFASPDTLVFTGESAGGFGAFSGYDIVRSYWKDEKVVSYCSYYAYIQFAPSFVYC